MSRLTCLMLVLALAAITPMVVHAGGPLSGGFDAARIADQETGEDDDAPSESQGGGLLDEIPPLPEEPPLKSMGTSAPAPERFSRGVPMRQRLKLLWRQWTGLERR